MELNDQPDFQKNPEGLLPAVAQDYKSREILMLGFINREAWEETLRSRYATYWSRSRKTLWKKGETSGSYQEVKDILIDCDEDAVIYKVKQIKNACHKGYRSCFYRKWGKGKMNIIRSPLTKRS